MVYEKLLILLGHREFEPGSAHALALPKMIPDKPAVLYTLGQVYEKLGRYDEAMTQYLEAIREFPTFLPVRLDLARLYMEQRKFGLAIEQYKWIVKEDPSHIETHFYLGFAYEMDGDLQNAAVHYRNFLDLAPEDLVNGPRRKMASEWFEKLKANVRN